MSKQILPVIEPNRQIAFYLRLQEIRRLYLAEALKVAISAVDLNDVDAELQAMVDPASLKKVAIFGLRGEVVFAVPTLLRASPRLLGYYRLLFGTSQKFFYRGSTFGRFKSMEERGEIGRNVGTEIGDLCLSLIKTGEMLVDRIDQISLTVVHELLLLTLGPQLKGGENNVVGEEAVKAFTILLKQLVSTHVKQTTMNSITIQNSAGRTVFIKMGSDPDFDISEISADGSVVPLVAIEVKGGMDNANKHNRLGEAEKSHLTARNAGHTRFWTVVMVDYTPASVAEKSPTTQKLWRLDRLKDPTIQESAEFRNLLSSVLGIPNTS